MFLLLLKTENMKRCVLACWLAKGSPGTIDQDLLVHLNAAGFSSFFILFQHELQGS